MVNRDELTEEQVLAQIEGTNEVVPIGSDLTGASGMLKKAREAKEYSKRQSADNTGHMHWSGNCLHLEGQITKEDPRLILVGPEKDRPLCKLNFGRSQGKISGTDSYKPWIFLECEIWGDYGVYVHDCFRKGERIAIKGRLEYREENGKDDQVYRKWILVADHVHAVEDGGQW